MHFDKKGNVEHLKWLSFKYCSYLSDFLAAIHSSLFYLGRIFLFLSRIMIFPLCLLTSCVDALDAHLTRLSNIFYMQLYL